MKTILPSTIYTSFEIPQFEKSDPDELITCLYVPMSIRISFETMHNLHETLANVTKPSLNVCLTQTNVVVTLPNDSLTLAIVSVP
jgi:hypothetical protein